MAGDVQVEEMTRAARVGFVSPRRRTRDAVVRLGQLGSRLFGNWHVHRMDAEAPHPSDAIESFARPSAVHKIDTRVPNGATPVGVP